MSVRVVERETLQSQVAEPDRTKASAERTAQPVAWHGNVELVNDADTTRGAGFAAALGASKAPPVLERIGDVPELLARGVSGTAKSFSDRTILPADVTFSKRVIGDSLALGFHIHGPLADQPGFSGNIANRQGCTVGAIPADVMPPSQPLTEGFERKTDFVTVRYAKGVFSITQKVRVRGGFLNMSEREQIMRFEVVASPDLTSFGKGRITCATRSPGSKELGPEKPQWEVRFAGLGDPNNEAFAAALFKESFERLGAEGAAHVLRAIEQDRANAARS